MDSSTLTFDHWVTLPLDTNLFVASQHGTIPAAGWVSASNLSAKVERFDKFIGLIGTVHLTLTDFALLKNYF